MSIAVSRALPAILPALLLATTAHAQDADDELIALGRDIFFNETFEGNGRTCGTCHRAEENFTITPEFIATLPDDDPVFVHERNPDLEGLENATLVRELAMFQENLDGFDQPPVFRGVPHTLALPTSILRNEDEPDEDQVHSTGESPVHALGWSADGSPGDGSLREFAIGAVIQHLPQTLARVEGEDFRLPTDEELDALEAFQLSLGRQEDLDLVTLVFTDPAVENGKDLFNGAANRSCSFCHTGAGANSNGFNDNFATNTAHDPDAPARALVPEIAADGGFGQAPTFEIVELGLEARGNDTFNVPPLVEAADTGPFFHNHSAASIEAAVTFYTTTLFDPVDPFQFNEQDIADVAAFLRAINALENMRMTIALAEQAQREEEDEAEETIELLDRRDRRCLDGPDRRRERAVTVVPGCGCCLGSSDGDPGRSRGRRRHHRTERSAQSGDRAASPSA